MKIVNGKNGTKLLLDLRIEQIIQFLKLQVPAKILSVSSDGEVLLNQIEVGKRIIRGRLQQIEVKNDKNFVVQNYDECIKEIWDILQTGMPVIQIDTGIYNRKADIIGLIGNIKEEIIKGCAYIDWEDGMLSVISKPEPKNPNKMYFWPKLHTLFLFSVEPMLIFNVEKESISELIC